MIGLHPLCICFHSAPSVSLGNVMANRSADGLSMTITWTPITLEDARGFPLYRITLNPGGTSRRRQSGAITVNVPFNESSYTATGLDPQTTYSVTVGAVVVNGSGTIEGPTSPPIEVTSPGQLLLHIRAVCYTVYSIVYIVK